MAAELTQNYGLSQWAATDSFVRTEFNQDNAKIDAALKDLEDTKAEQSALNSLSAAVSGKASQTDLEDLSDTVDLKCRIKAGTYVGNGGSRTVDVGFPIKAVLVEYRTGERQGNAAWGGLAVAGSTVRAGSSTLLSISGSTFTAYEVGEFTGQLCMNGQTYHYIAFG